MNLFSRPARITALWGVAAAVLSMAMPAMAQDDTYRVYVANEFGADITVIDSTSGDVIKTITISDRPGEVRPRGMAVSPDGKTIYVSVSDFYPERQTPEDKILAIDVDTNARRNADLGVSRSHRFRRWL
jgi:YVTN family beta-propeller protein